MIKENLFLGFFALLLMQCTTADTTEPADSILKKSAVKFDNENKGYPYYKTDFTPNYTTNVNIQARKKSNAYAEEQMERFFIHDFAKGNDDDTYTAYTHVATIGNEKKKIAGVTQDRLWKRQYIKSKENVKSDFIVMQFNMLASSSKEKSFDHVNPHKLGWSYRGPQIIEEMIRSEANVIVVEENDKFDYIKEGLNKNLQQKNWDGIVVKNPLSAHGISIYWNKKVFSYPPGAVLSKNNDKEQIAINVDKAETRHDLLVGEFPKLSIKHRVFKTITEEVVNEEGDIKEVTRYYYNGESGKLENSKLSLENEIKEPKEVFIAIKLTHIESEKDIVFVATHLKSEKSKIGEDTRLYEAKYLMDKVKENFEFPEGDSKVLPPIIFCADMNAGQVPLAKNFNVKLQRKNDKSWPPVDISSTYPWKITKVKEGLDEDVKKALEDAKEKGWKIVEFNNEKITEANYKQMSKMFKSPTLNEITIVFESVYHPDTYQYLTGAEEKGQLGLKDSQYQLLSSLDFNEKDDIVKSHYDHWTTANVQAGQASIMVEDYILYKSSKETKLTPVGHYSYPKLERMSPLFLPATYYPSHHIAITTGFTIFDTRIKIESLKGEWLMPSVLFNNLMQDESSFEDSLKKVNKSEDISVQVDLGNVKYNEEVVGEIVNPKTGDVYIRGKSGKQYTLHKRKELKTNVNEKNSFILKRPDEFSYVSWTMSGMWRDKTEDLIAVFVPQN